MSVTLLCHIKMKVLLILYDANDVQVSIKKTDIKMQDKVGTVSGTVTNNSMIVKTIVLTDDDIKSTSDWR